MKRFMTATFPPNNLPLKLGAVMLIAFLAIKAFNGDLGRLGTVDWAFIGLLVVAILIGIAIQLRRTRVAG